MTFNPDDKPRRMGAHVYSVEALDLSAHGMPGFAFTGDLHIEPDDTPGVEDWHIEDITAPGGYPLPPEPYEAVRAAVMADKALCADILQACYYHGEG
jgi:hypothetical protein